MPNVQSIDWLKLVKSSEVATGARILVLLVVGLPLLRYLSVLTGRLFRKHLSDQGRMLLAKAIFYAGFALIALTVLMLLDFPLTPFLGAAGVVGVAVGFASQTSLSNVISGLFLITEKPFAVGDVIQVGQTTGVVASIDLLSVKLRTFDNRFVRIPNESIIKTEITNITRFPIRRLDINLGVAYKEDIGRVIKILKEIADRNPFCLDEPEPVVIFNNFGDSALEFLLGVWVAKEDYLKLKNGIMKEIKERFDAEGIEIPFPHRTLYAGAVSDPFPVRLVQEGRQAPDVSSKPEL